MRDACVPANAGRFAATGVFAAAPVLAALGGIGPPAAPAPPPPSLAHTAEMLADRKLEGPLVGKGRVLWGAAASAHSGSERLQRRQLAAAQQPRGDNAAAHLLGFIRCAYGVGRPAPSEIITFLFIYMKNNMIISIALHYIRAYIYHIVYIFF